MDADNAEEPQCPRPEKRKFTQAEAEQTAKDARKGLNPDIQAYKCECGAWHIGKSKVLFSKRVRRVIQAGNHRRFESNKGRKQRHKR